MTGQLTVYKHKLDGKPHHKNDTKFKFQINKENCVLFWGTYFAPNALASPGVIP